MRVSEVPCSGCRLTVPLFFCENIYNILNIFVHRHHSGNGGGFHRRLAVDKDQAVQQPLKNVIGILLWPIAAKMILNLVKS